MLRPETTRSTAPASHRAGARNVRAGQAVRTRRKAAGATGHWTLTPEGDGYRRARFRGSQGRKGAPGAATEIGRSIRFAMDELRAVAAAMVAADQGNPRERREAWAALVAKCALAIRFATEAHHRAEMRSRNA